MSVTFYPSENPIVGYRFECHCGVVAAEFATVDEAHVWMDAYKANPYQLDGCADDLCVDYPQITNVTSGPEHDGVNMSNMNAADVLRVLGLIEPDQDADLIKPEVQWVGGLSASDFLGRVLMALAIEPESAEKVTHDAPGPGARMVVGGREAGYVQGRLRQLADVAEWAAEHERLVYWG